MPRSYGEVVRSPSPSPRGTMGSALALAREGTVHSGWALRESGPGKASRMRVWAYLNHHAAPDVVPPDGDSPVSVILLRVFDGLPIPAAAYFSIS